MKKETGRVWGHVNKDIKQNQSSVHKFYSSPILEARTLPSATTYGALRYCQHRNLSPEPVDSMGWENIAEFQNFDSTLKLFDGYLFPSYRPSDIYPDGRVRCFPEGIYTSATSYGATDTARGKFE